MISLELSTIQAKDAERAMLAEAMASFTGRIEVLPGFQSRPVEQAMWRNGLILPGSSQNTSGENKDRALSVRIAELTEKGAGITAIKLELHVDSRRIKRIAAEYGIPLNDIRYASSTVIPASTHQAKVAAGQRRRAKLAETLRPLAANGYGINAMSEATGSSKATILRTLGEFNIQRGTKMNLEA